MNILKLNVKSEEIAEDGPHDLQIMIKNVFCQHRDFSGSNPFWKKEMR